MKKASLLLTILISVAAFGQSISSKIPVDSITNKISFQGILYIDSSAKSGELFDRAKKWIDRMYTSPVDVIQKEDRSNGEIVGKASMQVYCKSLGSDRQCGFINYSLFLYFKDGRFKYVVTNFIHSGQFVNGATIPSYGQCENWLENSQVSAKKSERKISDYFLNQLNEKTLLLLDDLKTFMAKKINSTQDW